MVRRGFRGLSCGVSISSASGAGDGGGLCLLTQNGHPVGVAILVLLSEVRRCPTLPQGPPCSTIGAKSLSFRVRNVTGRFPLAIAAETPGDGESNLYFLVIEPSVEGVCSRPYIENHIVDACSLFKLLCYQIIGLLVPVSSVGL